MNVGTARGMVIKLHRRHRTWLVVVKDSMGETLGVDYARTQSKARQRGREIKEALLKSFPGLEYALTTSRNRTKTRP